MPNYTVRFTPSISVDAEENSFQNNLGEPAMIVMYGGQDQISIPVSRGFIQANEMRNSTELDNIVNNVIKYFSQPNKYGY